MLQQRQTGPDFRNKLHPINISCIIQQVASISEVFIVAFKPGFNYQILIKGHQTKDQTPPLKIGKES